MAYYDALKAKWATLSAGTTAEKLAAINAVMVAGPSIDVSVSSVVGCLMLSQSYLPLADFARGELSGGDVHDWALAAAKMLMTILTAPNAPAFQMSDASRAARIAAMMDAILAQEIAAPGSVGFTRDVRDALLALAATAIPWWQANGYSSPIGTGDLEAAGIS